MVDQPKSKGLIFPIAAALGTFGVLALLWGPYLKWPALFFVFALMSVLVGVVAFVVTNGITKIPQRRPSAPDDQK